MRSLYGIAEQLLRIMTVSCIAVPREMFVHVHVTLSDCCGCFISRLAGRAPHVHNPNFPALSRLANSTSLERMVRALNSNWETMRGSAGVVIAKE
jgi:hypothetical protein